MDTILWLVAIVLMAIGLIGTVLPVLPGTTIILGAALIHRIALGADRSLGWSALIALFVLTFLSYAIEAAAGFLGATRFGATRWGVMGAVVGGLAGMFFGLPGLFVGPVVGAFVGEILGGRQLIKATRAGWGTVLGSLAGAVGKTFIGLAMVAIFVTNVPSPF